MFPYGDKDGTVIDYKGGRNAASIIEWANEHLDDLKPPPEVYEVD